MGVLLGGGGSGIWQGAKQPQRLPRWPRLVVFAEIMMIRLPSDELLHSLSRTRFFVCSIISLLLDFQKKIKNEEEERKKGDNPCRRLVFFDLI
jgi:hypothetical protein